MRDETKWVMGKVLAYVHTQWIDTALEIGVHERRGIVRDVDELGVDKNWKSLVDGSLQVEQ